MLPTLRLAGLAGSALALAGCSSADAPGFVWSSPTPSPSPTASPTPSDGGFTVSDPLVPDAPIAGFERLVDETAARGLDVPLVYDATPHECPEINGNVTAADLDGDGDPDLLFHNRAGFPRTFENEGGHFIERVIERDVLGRFGRPAMSWAAVDLNGDGLPEVTVSGPNLALVSWNQGGWSFSEFEVLYDDPSYPRRCMNTQVWGDFDGDGDLDLVLPGTASALTEGVTFGYWDEEPPPGGMEVTNTPPMLLLNNGLPFDGPLPLRFAGDRGTTCIVGAATDRDLDGDLDLLLTSHRPIPPLPLGSVFRNDGPGADGWPRLTDDGGTTGVQFAANGMGMDSADLNGDGAPDWCFSDAGLALVCPLSLGGDRWFEGGQGIGLVTDPTRHPDYDGGDWSGLSGWSVELVDLDNDGEVDAALAAGGAPDTTTMPDALWRGLGGGRFEERTTAAGFGDRRNHYGMASADFDGDGFRDLVLAGWDGAPIFWSNPPGPNAWVDVRLRGAAGDAEGFGARVEVQVGERTWTRELHALRGLAQSEASVAFGLGDAVGIDRLRVTWPDGVVTEATDLPVRVRVIATHPEAP